jgi:hypothetical protein
MKSKKEAPNMDSVETMCVGMVMDFLSSFSGQGRQASRRQPLGASSRQTRSRPTSIQAGCTYHLLSERAREVMMMVVFSTKRKTTEKKRGG